MAIVISLLTVFATFAGGAIAVRSRDRMHIVLGLSGGLLLGLVAFDLLPEVLTAPQSTLGGVPWAAVAFVAGFLTLHVFERAVGTHEPAVTDYSDHHQHQHHTSGLLGAIAMVGHVFLDGVAVGVAFGVSTPLGVAVAIAVVAHAFSDGLNTVALLVKAGEFKRRAATLLGLDAVARISGATVGTFLAINDMFVTIYLAMFAGFLTYLATSHILPEAHSKHPSRWTLVATMLGVSLMLGIVVGGHDVG